jgi:hypothetical protein
MPTTPPAPDRLPSLEYNGHLIEVINHHGYSMPDRGPIPESRMLYAVRDGKNERHWRSSARDIEALINREFQTAPLPGQ